MDGISLSHSRPMSLMPMVCFTLTAPTAFYSKACRKVLGHYPWKVLDWPGNYAPHGHADPQIKSGSENRLPREREPSARADLWASKKHVEREVSGPRSSEAAGSVWVSRGERCFEDQVDDTCEPGLGAPGLYSAELIKN